MKIWRPSISLADLQEKSQRTCMFQNKRNSQERNGVQDTENMYVSEDGWCNGNSTIFWHRVAFLLPKHQWFSLLALAGNVISTIRKKRYWILVNFGELLLSSLEQNLRGVTHISFPYIKRNILVLPLLQSILDARTALLPSSFLCKINISFFLMPMRRTDSREGTNAWRRQQPRRVHIMLAVAGVIARDENIGG